MAQRWTFEALKKAGAKILEPSSAPKTTKRKKKPALTDAERAIAAAKRRVNHDKFESFWRQLGGPPLRAEYEGIPGRKYQMDYAHLGTKVCIELNGGTWSEGKTGHNSGTGLERDATKQNLAVLAGWTPFVLTASMLTKKNAPAAILPIIRYIEERTKKC